MTPESPLTGISQAVGQSILFETVPQRQGCHHLRIRFQGKRTKQNPVHTVPLKTGIAQFLHALNSQLFWHSDKHQRTVEISQADGQSKSFGSVPLGTRGAQLAHAANSALSQHVDKHPCTASISQAVGQEHCFRNPVVTEITRLCNELSIVLPRYQA